MSIPGETAAKESPAHDRLGQRESTGIVVATDTVMGDCALLTIQSDEAFARRLRPGQFVNILCRDAHSLDPLLRRPYSFYDVDVEGGTFTLLARPFGRGSQWLAGRRVGDVIDVMGPLGNSFEVASRSERLLMVAGGVGVSPLVHLATEQVRLGRSVTFLMGAANASALLDASRLPAAVEYIVATDDGSRGTSGFVTDLVPGYLSWADQVFACGPDPMLRSLNTVVWRERIGRRPGVSVSVERGMACGVGACLGCVLPTRHGMQTSCVTGPVFPIEEISW